MRISNAALQKAGTMGLDRQLGEHRSLAALLKHMVRFGALANGRRPPRGYTRRRFGEFALILREGVLIDIAYDGTSSRRPKLAA